MRRRDNIFRMVFLLLCCLSYAQTQAQDTMIYASNEIQHVSSGLRQLITSLKDSSLSKSISAIHIGDSHAAIGSFPKSIEQSLSDQGISVSEGWFFMDWTHNKLTLSGRTVSTDLYHHSPSPRFGISGRMLYPLSKNTIIRHDFPTEKAFTFLYHAADSTVFEMEKKHPETVRLERSGTFTSATFNLRRNEELKLKLNTEQQTSAFSLFFIPQEATRLYYSNLAVSGSQFDEYANALWLEDELRLLLPEIVIITLGTNDAYRMYRPEEPFELRVHKLLERIRKGSPQSEIILMTAPYTQWVGAAPQYLDQVNSAIRKIAQEQTISLWDWGLIAGGKEGFEAWNMAGMIDKDLLHYSKAGYTKLGALFAEALLKADR